MQQSQIHEKHGIDRAAILPEACAWQELTRRELEVLKLICDEYTGKQIAETLGISLRTAVCHRENIMSKLQARNTAGIVRRAISRGLILP